MSRFAWLSLFFIPAWLVAVATAMVDDETNIFVGDKVRRLASSVNENMRRRTMEVSEEGVCRDQETIDFPSASSDIVRSPKQYFWSVQRGDKMEETVSVPSSWNLDRLVVRFCIADNLLNRGAQVDWDVFVNGIVVGGFTIDQGIMGCLPLTFAFGDIQGATFTIVLAVTNEVPYGYGSHNIDLEVSNTLLGFGCTLLGECEGDCDKVRWSLQNRESCVTYSRMTKLSNQDSDCDTGLLCADEHNSELRAFGLDPKWANCGNNGLSSTDEVCFPATLLDSPPPPVPAGDKLGECEFDCDQVRTIPNGIMPLYCLFSSSSD